MVQENTYETGTRGLKDFYTFCIVCKEKISSRFEIEVKDAVIKNTIRGHVCRDCFESFLQSYHGRSRFSTSRFLHRLRMRQQDFRL